MFSRLMQFWHGPSRPRGYRFEGVVTDEVMNLEPANMNRLFEAMKKTSNAISWLDDEFMPRFFAYMIDPDDWGFREWVDA